MIEGLRSIDQQNERRKRPIRIVAMRLEPSASLRASRVRVGRRRSVHVRGTSGSMVERAKEGAGASSETAARLLALAESVPCVLSKHTYLPTCLLP